MKKPATISIRISVSPEVYERVSEFRHAHRFETRSMATLALVVAGLAALAAPVALPGGAHALPRPVAVSRPPGKPRPLDRYAGADRTERQIDEVGSG
jgi:hypothetical protein